MDIVRYGDLTLNREYIRQTTGQFYSHRFVMAYPNEQLPAGRSLRKTLAYDAMSAAGGGWGCAWVWRRRCCSHRRISRRRRPGA